MHEAEELEDQFESSEEYNDEEHITKYEGVPDHSPAPDSAWVEFSYVENAELVDIEEPISTDVEESSVPPVQPEFRPKRTCLRLAENGGPDADDDGDELKCDAVAKKGGNVHKRLPRSVVRAEKSAKDRKRRTNLVAEKKLDALMQKLNILKCPICEEPQNTFLDIGKHFLIAHQVPAIRRYVVCCDEKQFRDRVYDHMRYHQKKDAFQCSICGELCKSAVDHDRHIRRKHGIQEVKPVPCAICPCTFWTEKELNTHLYHTHRPTTGLECEECGKRESNH